MKQSLAVIKAAMHLASDPLDAENVSIGEPVANIIRTAKRNDALVFAFP